MLVAKPDDDERNIMIATEKWKRDAIECFNKDVNLKKPVSNEQAISYAFNWLAVYLLTDGSGTVETV